MKWRKLAALCLSLSMMVTTLTACGGGSTGGDITESGETFAEQVDDWLVDAGYNADVVQSDSLDNAVKYCASEGYNDKYTIQAEMNEKFGWISSSPENGGIVKTGIVHTIPETDLKAGNPKLDVGIDEAVLAKFAPIDSAAKVAAFQVAMAYEAAEQQGYTILELNASWAKAEPEEGEPYWIIVVQMEVEVPAEG